MSYSFQHRIPYLLLLATLGTGGSAVPDCESACRVVAPAPPPAPVPTPAPRSRPPANARTSIPRREIEHQVITIIMEHVAPPGPVTLRSRLTEIGADSLDLVEIVMAVEEEYSIEIADDEACAWRTVGDISDSVASRVNPHAGSRRHRAGGGS